MHPADRASLREEFAPFTLDGRMPTLPAPADARYHDISAMDIRGKGEELHGVEYLSEQARQIFKVTIENGLLFDANQMPIDTTGSHAIYGMDHDGNIYIATGHVGIFHHSSFLAGDGLAAGGEIHVEQGKVQIVNRRSGHYLPSLEQLDQFVAELHRQGVTGFTTGRSIEPATGSVTWLQNIITAGFVSFMVVHTRLTVVRKRQIDSALKRLTPQALKLARLAALERRRFRREIAAAAMERTVEDLSPLVEELTQVFGSEAWANELAFSRIRRQMSTDQERPLEEALQQAHLALDTQGAPPSPR